MLIDVIQTLKYNNKLKGNNINKRTNSLSIYF